MVPCASVIGGGNCRSLGCAQDDKGAGGAFHQHLMLMDRTAGPSTSLRFGRDDNSYLGTGWRLEKNCHSGKKVTSARDDRGEGGASM